MLRKVLKLCTIIFFCTAFVDGANAQGASCTLEKSTKDAINCLEKKINDGKVDNTPAGLVAFFNLAQCPSGWTPEDLARGRYIVGLNAPGKLGAAVGTALTDQENRVTGKHSHSFTDHYNKHNASGGYLAGGGSSGSHPFPSTTDTTGGKDGTNAPYLQLLPCKKL